MKAFARIFAVAALAVAVSNGSLFAQSTLGEMRRQATRGELEQSAKAAEEAAATTRDPKMREKSLADANNIRQRLKNGDFAPGDRIMLQVFSDSVLTDTFTVRADRMLRLPHFPDISLAGVLDSELEPYLQKSLAVYIKDPRVTANTLVSVAVLGAVGHSGFMTVPADQALTDVLTAAGGLGGSADLDRAYVKRGNGTAIDRRAFADALRKGRTVGDVAIRNGDQIIIPDKTGRFSPMSVVAALGAISGAVWVIRYGFGRGRRGIP